MDIIPAPLKENELPAAYVIQSKISGMRYIGSSATPIRRLHHHRNRLRNNRHVNNNLQLLWNDLDEPDFYCVIYYTESREQAYQLEKALIEDVAAEDKILNVYNVLPTRAKTSRIPREKIRRIAKIATGKRKQSAEHSAKLNPTRLKNNELKSRKVLVDGNIYPSVRGCARYFGVSDKTVWRRIISVTKQFEGWQYETA